MANGPFKYLILYQELGERENRQVFGADDLCKLFCSSEQHVDEYTQIAYVSEA